MEQNSQFLGTEPVGRLMRRYAVPCIISLLVGALYNIVDQIFIANASYLGSYGNAANTVVFPLTVVALAIAVMIGDGCCAFVSISLGQGDQAAAKRSVGNAVVMGVAFLFYGHVWAFVLPLVYLGLHYSAYRKIVKINKGKALNMVLGLTARNMFVYGMLVSIGFLLDF